MTTLSCIIVDDEPMARKGLAEDIQAIGFIEVAGLAANALQAVELITQKQPGLIFLDIEMPGFNGLELIKTLTNPPMVIITTAYPEYALEGYQLDVIDYLLKPIAFDRLAKACNKAKSLYELKQLAQFKAQTGSDYIFIKYNGKHEKILLNDVLFVEAANNYVTLHTVTKSYLTYQTLKKTEESLPAANFMQVHKSYIVAIDKISNISGNEIAIQKHRIPISRNYKEAVMQRVLHSKVIAR